MKTCSDPKCNAPGVSCRMGELKLEDCPNWRDAGAPKVRSPAATEDKTRLPWSGAALGTTDLPFLTSRGEPKLIALVGPHNAGKTTILGSWYQLVGRSGRAGEALFAGSYSLEGWEAVAHALRWDGGAPGFPPHTSSGAGRRPGLLHLAFREADRMPVDYLFADAPGEWFHRWAVDQNALDAEGARWLADHASAFVVVADCEALAGRSRGEARNDLGQLIRRLGSVRRGRPVALVWAKADVEVSAGIRDAIWGAMRLAAPDAAQFRTSVSDFSIGDIRHDAAASMLDLLAWSFERTARGFDIPRSSVSSDDPFFLVGAQT